MKTLKLFQNIQVIEFFVFADEIRYRMMKKEHPKYHVICIGCETTMTVKRQPLYALVPDSGQARIFNFGFGSETPGCIVI
ncbi:transcriptional repressor [Cohnella algarum]|nr:transcriptional repressor [Cohnella algarum]